MTVSDGQFSMDTKQLLLIFYRVFPAAMHMMPDLDPHSFNILQYAFLHSQKETALTIWNEFVI